MWLKKKRQMKNMLESFAKKEKLEEQIALLQNSKDFLCPVNNSSEIPYGSVNYHNNLIAEAITEKIGRIQKTINELKL